MINKEEGNLQDRAERISWIDTARGIGVLLVMLGHCYLDGKFTFWFYSFHVGLFFVISGYVFTVRTTYVDFIKKKTKTLLVPYVFCAVVTMILENVLAITQGNKYDILGTIRLYVVQNRYTPLWFITCLYVSELIMYLKYVLWKRHNTSFWIICAIVETIGFSFYQNFVGSSLPWNVDLVMLALAFMSFGKWIREKLVLEILNRMSRKRIIWGIISIFGLIISGYNYYYFGKVDWFSSDFGNFALFVCAAVIGILVTLGMSSNIRTTGLTLLGTNSLLFFGLHRLFIDLTFVLYNKLRIRIVSGNVVSVFWAIVSVSVVILILTPFVLFVKKYLPWCVGKRKDIV